MLLAKGRALAEAKSGYVRGIKAERQTAGTALIGRIPAAGHSSSVRPTGRHVCTHDLGPQFLESGTLATADVCSRRPVCTVLASIIAQSNVAVTVFIRHGILMPNQRFCS